MPPRSQRTVDDPDPQPPISPPAPPFTPVPPPPTEPDPPHEDPGDEVLPG